MIRLSNWQALMKMSQTIQKKWKNDYLGHLQQRIKWFVENENLGYINLAMNMLKNRWCSMKSYKIVYCINITDKLLQ